MKVVKRDGSTTHLDITKIHKVTEFACEGLNANPAELEAEAQIKFKNGIKTSEIQQLLILAAVNKISDQTPDYTYVAARLILYDLYKQVAHQRGYTVKDKLTQKYSPYNAEKFVDFIYELVEKGIYNKLLIEKYTREELLELAKYIKHQYDYKFTYAGIKTLIDKYLIKDNNNIIELPQEMYMLNAMVIASNEAKEERVKYAKLYYDYTASFKISLATPILMNARKKYNQLASCFIIDVEDDLYDIYESLKQSALISKYAGGLGIYLGHIRAMGSQIQNYKNVCSGVLPVVKIFNDTMLYVNQLGLRKGSASITLDIWHKDILDFLEVKTNARDDRIKAYDIHPAISIPDLFMKRLLNNQHFTLFDPYYTKKDGIRLEDTYGEEFEQLYEYFEQTLPDNAKLVLQPSEVQQLWKQLLSIIYEVGEPYLFFRDTANRLNPNKHVGIVHCSNLCHEIIQNTSPKKNYTVYKELDVDFNDQSETYKVHIEYEAGNMVVCNLASINLAEIDNLEKIAYYTVRILNNIIDLSMPPVKDVEITNELYRAIGIGVNNYHYALVKNNIKFDSEEHLEFADKLFEQIAYYVLKASSELAKERGKTYKYFSGSDWQKGIFFGRDVATIQQESKAKLDWLKLYQHIQKYGLLNGYLLAIMPTGSTSIICGATASIDPIFAKFYKDENMHSIMPQTPPEVDKYYWYYKSAFNIDQEWIIKAAAVRQKWIDQAQSLNLFIDPDNIDGPTLSNLYIEAWKSGLKTVYYLRSKTKTDITEECTSCQA